jgi:hypothetical protein
LLLSNYCEYFKTAHSGHAEHAEVRASITKLDNVAGLKKKVLPKFNHPYQNEIVWPKYSNGFMKIRFL